MGKLFGTDGIRSRAGRGIFEPDYLRKFARALGYIFRKSPGLFSNPLPQNFAGVRDFPGDKICQGFVLIGRDTRESGSEIEEGLIDGFLTHNLPVATVGVIPTPGLAHLVRLWGASLGIMISASHNPARDNGLKLISPEGMKVPDKVENDIEHIFFDKVFGTKLHRSDTVKILPPRNLTEKSVAYIEYLISRGGSLSGLKIVIDCANGAASEYAPKVLGELGAEVIVLNDTPDGTNINEGCGAMHPQGLQKTVVQEGAHVGVAFDGDADRAIFVDETGKIRDGEYVLALSALDMKKNNRLPDPRVVSTVMANFGVEAFLNSNGIELLRTKVGDRYVSEKMLEEGLILGGEPSGHTIFFEDQTTGDGLATAIRFLGLLSGGVPFSALCSPVQKFPQVILNVRIQKQVPIEELATDAVAKAEKELAGKGRVYLRYSGTESLLRIMVEGDDRARVDKIAKAVAEACHKEIG